MEMLVQPKMIITSYIPCLNQQIRTLADSGGQKWANNCGTSFMDAPFCDFWRRFR